MVQQTPDQLRIVMIIIITINIIVVVVVVVVIIIFVIPSQKETVQRAQLHTTMYIHKFIHLDRQAHARPNTSTYAHTHTHLHNCRKLQCSGNMSKF